MKTFLIPIYQMVEAFHNSKGGESSREWNSFFLLPVRLAAGGFKEISRVIRISAIMPYTENEKSIFQGIYNKPTMRMQSPGRISSVYTTTVYRN